MKFGMAVFFEREKQLSCKNKEGNFSSEKTYVIVLCFLIFMG